MSTEPKLMSVIPKDSTCACAVCVSMCERRPCWPTPPEAQRIIDAGFGKRLWRDYWTGSDKGDIPIAAPAAVGYEGQNSPFIPRGRCTFLTKDGRCELHDLGLKPFEGRKALHGKRDRKVSNVHEHCAATWNTAAGRKVFGAWQRLVGLTKEKPRATMFDMLDCLVDSLDDSDD